MASVYHLRLDKFEGPLDLLLHLIKVHEIDIFNIDVYLLADQYLSYLRAASFQDLADAGEFIDMASHLIEIKSRRLLPIEEQELEVADGEDEVTDPVAQLQQRLQEYELIRSASDYLQAMAVSGEGVAVSTEPKRLMPYYSDIEAPLKGDATSMVLVFEQVLRAFVERKPAARVEAIAHRVGVQETMDNLARLLDTVKFALFQGFYNTFTSRYDLVVHILAVLEMVRWGRAKVYQAELNGPIWLYHVDFDPQNLPSNRAYTQVGEELPCE